MSDLEPVDVARLIKDWLKTDLASTFPTLSVRLELPSTWTLGDNPVLVVADDGATMGMWPAATDPTIRCTTWTAGRITTYAYAAWSRLLDKNVRIPGVAAIRPGTGFLEDIDSSNGGDLVSFTVIATVRTQNP